MLIFCSATFTNSSNLTIKPNQLMWLLRMAWTHWQLQGRPWFRWKSDTFLRVKKYLCIGFLLKSKNKNRGIPNGKTTVNHRLSTGSNDMGINLEHMSCCQRFAWLFHVVGNYNLRQNWFRSEENSFPENFTTVTVVRSIRMQYCGACIVWYCGPCGVCSMSVHRNRFVM